MYILRYEYCYCEMKIVNMSHTISNRSSTIFMFIKLNPKKNQIAKLRWLLCCSHNHVWHEEAINVSHIICAIEKKNLTILTSSLLYKSLLLNIYIDLWDGCRRLPLSHISDQLWYIFVCVRKNFSWNSFWFIGWSDWDGIENILNEWINERSGCEVKFQILRR